MNSIMEQPFPCLCNKPGKGRGDNINLSKFRN